jgi:rubrerythrin
MSNPFHDPQSVTIQNLEAAFAGESMAHIKYRYFAKLCRAMGDDATAKVFEDTAEQEILHAFGHADLLFPAALMSPAKALALAIEGETYEYTEMYPQFRHAAEAEGNTAAAQEMDAQISESKAHAEMFQAVLVKASKRFAALAKVEERHAKHYQATLDKVNA